MEEQWRDVCGYVGLYRISSLGRVFSIRKRKILQPFVSRWGYEIVTFYRDGKVKKESVHRLVAVAFVDNPNNFPIVDHLDGNKRNNNAINLEWCTTQENTQRAFDKGLCDACRKASRKTGKTVLREYGLKNSIPVRAFDLSGAEVGTYSSLSEAARELGISAGDISYVLSGRYKQANGYTFTKVKGENNGK